MKKEKTQNKNISVRGAFRIVLTGFVVMLLVAVFCAVYFSAKMEQVSETDSGTYEIYARHYVFITDDAEKEFWNEVYAAAVEEGEKENVYVERLGENLNVNYQTEDLLRIANHSSVDGIIFCGEGNEETVRLIGEAVQNGTGVVSLRQDIEDSERQCFVGVNSYDLGLEYGKQILELAKLEEMRNPRICILADDTMGESKQNLITFAIRDSFSDAAQGEENLPDIEIRKIDTSDAFSAEEAIRDIFIDSQNLPDIMVCLNSVYTQCTYQAAVDYNRVGDIKILGYYTTDAILEAVEKQIIYSTVQVDTGEMGSQCIKALTEYNESGYTSSYVPISTKIIGAKEAEELRRKGEAEQDGS
ncbi:MAG: sugar ABC transporter substrate-binding protein [Lachnospiraceae bacterium]|jgi:ribose transport system substrate-binding protein|nr:sugar ABC transporter substrate-binding protein [Lachnospiraceae bacterium]